MKTSRAFALGAAALAIGFVAARWCAVQSSNQPPADFAALQRRAQYLTYLQNTKQTNTTYQDWTTISLASEHLADLGETLAILRSLREGRTNQVYELLEERLDTEIMGFVGSYRQLPASAREQPGLKVLGRAKDYRAKYPFRSPILYPNVDAGVADAFKILEERP